MTQLLEAVGPTGPWSAKWECPVNHDALDPKETEEELEAREKEEEAEALAAANHQDLHNSASKLGDALAKDGGAARVDSSTGGGTVKVPKFKPVSGNAEFDYTVAAHHLVPGNASLKPSTIVKYISKTKQHIQENIGYNVNGHHNGIWLPGSYAVRAATDNTPVEDTSWGDVPVEEPDFQEAYVRAVVRKARGAMFHDTHATYSKNVLNILDEAAAKIEKKPGDYHCDDCKELAKGKGGKLPPPYWVNGAMSGLSGWLKRRLSPTRKWELDRWATTERHLDTLRKMKAGR